MKKILLGFMLLSSSVAISQKTLTFKDMATIKKGAFESIECDIYIGKDGHSYKVGDTLKIGRPSSSKTFAYISSGGALTGFEPLEINQSGKNTTIKKIVVAGNKNTGFYIAFKASGVCDLCGNNFITNFEEAVATGEIQSLGMTREQAIAKLKEAKDLVDLGMMSKEDFEKLKTELTPLIINK
jgi:hypothetical protein